MFFDAAPRPASQTSTPVWAIGGGKGGVGKSVVALNLAVALADRGLSVALVDADLGGANLHTLLGMAPPRRSLSDLLARKVTHLEAVLTPTPVERLSLIGGTHALLDVANPSWTQKEKLLRHIRSLAMDAVILDLGAGSSFTVLDFFVAADRGLLVVVPEATSIENAYHFLKAAYLRHLRRADPSRRLRDVLERVMRDREERGVRSPRDLVDEVLRREPELGVELDAAAAGFQPAIVVNRVESDADRRLAPSIAQACRQYFGSRVEALGALDFDPAVPAAARARRPVLRDAPEAPFSRALRILAERVDELLGSAP